MYLENHIYYYTSKLLLRQYLTVNFLMEVLLRFAQKNDLPTRIHTSFGFASVVFIKSPGQVSRSNPRPISTGQLHTLLYFHTQPIYLVVFKGSYFFERMGYLILRGASRLDAFSVYPRPTWLPGCGPGGPTGAPEVSPPRSSRTKGSSSQISFAHAG